MAFCVVTVGWGSAHPVPAVHHSNICCSYLCRENRKDLSCSTPAHKSPILKAAFIGH